MGTGASADSRGLQAHVRAEQLIKVSELRPKGQTAVSIPQTEDRAITVAQLETLVAYLDGHCKAEGWTSCNQATPRLKLDPRTINLYDVVFWVIKPATKGFNCSYVELIATSAQMPTWFVSHWWGEPVRSFVACLRGHMRDRRLHLHSTCAYWVCAYANNQWQASAEVGDDPAQSSFRRAIGKSVGTVTILDDTATTYTRIWCSYEIFVTLADDHRSMKYMYDVYTATAGATNVVGLTDGCVAVDGVDTYPESVQALLKSQREGQFPIKLIQKGLDSEITKAQASEMVDRVHILNAIVGSSDMNATPPETHECYDFLDNKLRAYFAARSLHMVTQEDVVDAYARAMLESRLAEMSFALTGARDESLALRILQRGLPDSLNSLKVVWYFSQLGSTLGAGMALALGHLQGLERLDLDLWDSKIGMEGAAALVKTIGTLGNLEELKFSVVDNGLDDAVVPCLADAVRSLPVLKKVEVSLRGNHLGDAAKNALKELEQEIKARLQPVDIRIHA